MWQVVAYVWLLCGLGFLAIVLFDGPFRLGTDLYSEDDISWLDEQDGLDARNDDPNSQW